MDEGVKRRLVWQHGEDANLSAIQPENSWDWIIQRANPKWRLGTIQEGFYKWLRRGFRNRTGFIQEFDIIHSEVIPGGNDNVGDPRLLNEV